MGGETVSDRCEAERATPERALSNDPRATLMAPSGAPLFAMLLPSLCRGNSLASRNFPREVLDGGALFSKMRATVSLLL